MSFTFLGSDVHAILRGILQQPHVQCSTTDQAHALSVIAGKFGLNLVVAKITEGFTHPMTLRGQHRCGIQSAAVSTI